MSKIIDAQKAQKKANVKNQFKYINTGSLIRDKLDGKVEFRNYDTYINRVEALLHREMDALPKNKVVHSTQEKYRHITAEAMPMTLRTIERKGKIQDLGC